MRRRAAGCALSCATRPSSPAPSILGVFVLLALFADWICPGDPQDMVAQPLLWPGEDAQFPLGTDSLGRDVLSNARAWRARLAAGRRRGGVDRTRHRHGGGRARGLLRRPGRCVADAPGRAVPDHAHLPAGDRDRGDPRAVARRPSRWRSAWPRGPRWRGWCARSSARCASPISSWPRAAWAIRSTRIIVQEILPNALPPVIVAASVMIANAILTEAGLSFLNMRDANVVSWGGMIGDGRDLLRTAWFLTALPGAAIAHGRAVAQPGGRRAERDPQSAERAMSLLAVDKLTRRLSRPHGRARGELRHRARRDPGAGGRVRLRQVGDGLLGDAAPAAQRDGDVGPHPVRRSRSSDAGLRPRCARSAASRSR